MEEYIYHLLVMLHHLRPVRVLRYKFISVENLAQVQIFSNQVIFMVFMALWLSFYSLMLLQRPVEIVTFLHLYRESGNLQALFIILRTQNISTSFFQEQRLNLVMSFCAEEKCNCENVLQKLPDHLINLRTKTFTILKFSNFNNFIKLMKCNSKSFNSHSLAIEIVAKLYQEKMVDWEQQGIQDFFSLYSRKFSLL